MVRLCKSATIFPTSLHISELGFSILLPSRKDIITAVLFFIFFKIFPFLSEIAFGHLKLFLFKKFFKFIKKGNSCSVTLFSKIVKIYG